MERVFKSFLWNDAKLCANKMVARRCYELVRGGKNFGACLIVHVKHCVKHAWLCSCVGVACWKVKWTLRTDNMACYTADEVVQLLDEYETAVNVICMDGSDDELDFEEMEVGSTQKISEHK